MISMRQLTAADAALLSEMGGLSLLESHGHSAPAATMQAYVAKSFSEEACRAELAEKQNVFWGVFYKGELAGYFKIIFQTPQALVPLQPVTKLERLYLLKKYYGRQLGHSLLDKAVALSKEAGDKGLWLDVWKENGRALRFYQKVGFEVVGESRFFVSENHGNPIWVMVMRYEKDRSILGRCGGARTVDS